MWMLRLTYLDGLRTPCSRFSFSSRAFLQRQTYFRLSTRPSTSSQIWGNMSGSPPGMRTTCAPRPSPAFRHCSSVRCFLRIWAGYWILPHPAHVRLQRKSGSSISTNGYRSRRESFCLRTYAATVHIWESGTLIIHLPRGGGGGRPHPPPPGGGGGAPAARSGKHIARANFTSRHGPSARERPEPEQNGGVQQEAGRQQQRLPRPPPARPGVDTH